jgi:hypothetical protein
MNYQEAMNALLHALDNNPSTHANLQEAIETILLEPVKAAGKAPSPELLQDVLKASEAQKKHGEEEDLEPHGHKKSKK